MSWRSKTYDELPALSVRGTQLRQSLRTVTAAWMLGIVWMTLTAGSTITQYCQMLGFSQFAFGLLGAIPYIATFGQLIAAVFIERTGLKKYQFLQCGTVSRAMWLLLAAIPLVLPVPSQAAVVATLVVLGLSGFLGALGAPACMTWLGDLIPRRIRGRYFALRFQLARPIQISVVIVMWLLLDAVTRTRSTDPRWVPTFASEPALMWMICAMFVAAAFFGAADIMLFRRVREVVRCVGEDDQPSVAFPRRPADRGLRASASYWIKYGRSAVRQLLLEPMQDRVFRHYALYMATLAFAMAAPGMFFWLNCMNNLGFSMGATQFLFMVVSPVLGLLGARLWGKALDRWGRRPVLMVSSMLTLLSIMPWFFARRETPSPAFVRDWANAAAGAVAGLFGHHDYVLLSDSAPVGAFLLAMLCSFFGGIAWTGVQLAQNNVLLSFSDGKGRSKFVAASAVLASLGGGLGGIVGGLVAQGLQWMRDNPLDFGVFHWNQWHVTFLISMVVRGLAVLWLVNMPDPGAARTRDMVRYFMSSAGAHLTAFMVSPLRLFGVRGDRR